MRLCGVLLAVAGGVDDAEPVGVLVGLEGGLAGGAVVHGGVDGAVQLHQAVAQVSHTFRGGPRSGVQAGNEAPHTTLVESLSPDGGRFDNALVVLLLPRVAVLDALLELGPLEVLEEALQAEGGPLNVERRVTREARRRRHDEGGVGRRSWEEQSAGFFAVKP